jgi:hypothetical protein
LTNIAINNKKYGFNAEAELMQWFREHDSYCDGAERLHLAGKEDEGDLVISRLTHPVIIQLKTYAARTTKGGERPLPVAKVRRWWKDLEAQREAYRAHRGLSEAPPGLLVVRVKNTSWDDAMIIQRLGDWAS